MGVIPVDSQSGGPETPLVPGNNVISADVQSDHPNLIISNTFISDDYLRVKDKKYTSTPPITSRTSNDLNKVTPTTPSMPTLSKPTPPPAVAIQPSIPPKLPDQPNNSTNTILTQSNNSVPNTTTNTLI